MYEAKVGILGGGQLGKMLCNAAAPWNMPLAVMDKDHSFPAAPFAHPFVKGDFKRYEDVYAFGSELDIITVEIETINIRGLQDLESSGKKIFPLPETIRIIKDKGEQKRFYKENNLPTASFILTEDAEEINRKVSKGQLTLPFVQKARLGGYDGRGVNIVRNKSGLSDLMDVPSVIEPLIPLKKELAVIVARNPSGTVRIFQPVEMVFDPDANLVLYLICPAQIEESVADECRQIARELAEKINLIGILAIEFFYTDDGKVLINESAPRPHNSGHHTIESTSISQYEMHLRAILDLPLPEPVLHTPALMLNVLGSEGFEGVAKMAGLKESFSEQGFHWHWYGKTHTRPFRKMGHITLTGKNTEDLIKRSEIIADQIRITA